MAAVEEEKEAGFVSGRIYFDAIGMVLASAFAECCSHWRQYRGGLAPMQLRRVISFIQEHLNRIGSHQFLLNARVERAKDLLQKSDGRIMDVAIACSFQTQQHFARSFRTISKISPTQFRRMKVA